MASSLTHLSRKIFGSKNERELKRMRPVVDDVNALEEEFAKKSDVELRALIPQWKERVAALTEHQERDKSRCL